MLVFTTLLCGCSESLEEKKKSAEVIAVPACYAVDIRDPRALAASVDHVFVAALTDTGEVKDISDKRALPCTVYEAEVLETLKGDLETDTSILLEKEGGYSEKDDGIYLYEDDYMPKTGDVCLIYAHERDDGSLLASGENTTARIAGAGEDYTGNEKYLKAVDGVSHQIP